MKIPNALKQFNEFITEVEKLDTDNTLELVKHANDSDVYCVMVEGTNHGIQLHLDKHDMVIDYMSADGHKRFPVTFDVKGTASRAVLFLQWRRNIV